MPRFVPRQRKHKRQQHEARQEDASDPNAIQLIAPTQSEKDEKKRKLREEVRNGQPEVSGKKAKRLDKYIENKLKRDENLDLLKKLAESQKSFDTSGLRSSRHLGKRKRDEFVATNEDGQAAVEITNAVPTVDEDSDANSEDSFEQEHPEAFDATQGVEVSLVNPVVVPPAQSGSGLKQPLKLGRDGLPELPFGRNGRRKEDRVAAQAQANVPWEGFSDEEEGHHHSEDNSEGMDEEADDETAEEDDSSISLEDSTHSSGSKEDSDTSQSADAADGRLKPRNSAFKSWAMQQINKSLEYSPAGIGDSDVLTGVPAPKERLDEVRNSRPTVGHMVPTKESLDRVLGSDTRKAYNVEVSRSEEVQAARMELPIVAEEQKIMEAIYNNPVTIVWGSTGSGKTTQVPQFLFEAGYSDPNSPTPGMIGVTQPRRVAAVSMAKRVSDEIGQHGDRVSYQIRFDSSASAKTAIKFMTDGILIREISQDFSLSKYSVIVIDEAHERSVNTDILIGMISRIVDLRAKLHEEHPATKPLKMVIMSATLRMSDFLQNTNLFRSGPPPLVQAEGRQHPVTTHFSRRTHRDYLEESFRKVTKGHKKLPPGGMLVFLTGQNEIKDLLKRLEAALGSSKWQNNGFPKVHVSASETPLETEDLELVRAGADQDENSDTELLIHDEGSDEEDDFDVGEAEQVDQKASSSSPSGVHILPLYSQLPTKEQLRIFDPPPLDHRLILLATNVAETSLTIPGIRYVFDCGRSKERVYNITTGVQSFEIDWISKASAEQRAGRAGRTGPGHCYRLYSSAVYERDFAQHAEPEILRTPMENVVLQMKSMGIDKVANFPFPTPPDRQRLVKAEELLRNLGALSSVGRVTELGKKLSHFPLSPRYGKMLAIGTQHDCLPYMIALVAGLSVGDLFVAENQIDMTPVGRQKDQVYSQADQEQDNLREQRRKNYTKARNLFSIDNTSDALKVLAAVCGYAYEDDSWANEMFLRPKAMKEVAQLRRQLTDVVQSNDARLIGGYQARLLEAKPKQLSALRQMVTAGFIDQVAIRADRAPYPPNISRKPKRAIDVPYLPLLPLHGGSLDEKAVYIHPSSILSRSSPEKLPKYLVYSHLQQAASSHIASEKTPKIRMFPLTSTGDVQLAALAHDTPLLVYGKPIGQITSLGGFPEKRECWVVPFLVGEAGGQGWPLKAKKVLQRKDPRTGWIIETFLS